MVYTDSLSRSRQRSGVNETIVTRARDLVPELRARSEEIHTLGRIPASLFERVEAAGLLKLSTPRSYGGLEVNVNTRKAALAQLGRGDLSVGLVFSLMNHSAWGLYSLYPKHLKHPLSPSP